MVVPSDIGLLPWVAMAWMVLMFLQRFSMVLSGFHPSVSLSRFVLISDAVSVPYVVVKWVMMEGINTSAYPNVLSSRS